MKVFGVAGWSGSGKTALLVRLLPELVGRGFSVSTVKHSHHRFDIDRPGKDSFRHREAGASEVMISSSARWALMHELRDEPEPDMDSLLARMTPVDLILVEGFKSYPHAKLEVHRPSVGKSVLCTQDPSIVAVASDVPLAGLKIPVLDLRDTAGIADFVVRHCGLGVVRRHGTA